MKRSRFSEAQVAFVLRQAEEGTKVEEVCRKAGISPATFYAWKAKYGGMSASGPTSASPDSSPGSMTRSK